MLYSYPERTEKASVIPQEIGADGDGKCVGVFVSEDQGGKPDQGDEKLEFFIFADGQITMDERYYLTAVNLQDIAAAYRQCGFKL